MDNSPQIICTIIAKNYLAFARTLCQSFYAHSPWGKCFVLIIDQIDGYIDPQAELFEIIQLSELGIPNLRQFCFKYNITELSTAVKPFLIRYLFKSRRINKILYLDPDILITASLDNLFDQLEVNDIVITPHLDTDYPNDNKKPDQELILMCGTYNLGFIGLRNCPKADQFLQWWCQKLYNRCIINQARGYFVDQRFMELALSFFPWIFTIRDVGYNVAFWNIHSRTISYINNTWLCNSEPLFFFHFSNYKPEYPETISGHQNRFSLIRGSALYSLFTYYREQLIKNGHYQSVRMPYSFAKFSNGIRISDFMRYIFRMNMSKLEAKDPFQMKRVFLMYIGIRWIIGKFIIRQKRLGVKGEAISIANSFFVRVLQMVFHDND
jgi:hypothetical protein